MRRRAALSFVLLALVVACADKPDEPDADGTLLPPVSNTRVADSAPDEQADTASEVFCGDVAAGRAPRQAFESQDEYTSPKEFAQYAVGAMSLSCRDQLDENQPWRAWLQQQGVDPDGLEDDRQLQS
jgi:hypothetical protein